MPCWLVGWLAGLFVGLLVGWSVGSLVCWLVVMLDGWLVGRYPVVTHLYVTIFTFTPQHLFAPLHLQRAGLSPDGTIFTITPPPPDTTISATTPPPVRRLPAS